MPHEYAQEDQFCDEFHLVDLRLFENCKKVCSGADHVFNLAADMGGMGFIQSNHSVILYNNTMISYNMLEAARQCGVTRCAAAGCGACMHMHACSMQCQHAAPRAHARGIPAAAALL